VNVSAYKMRGHLEIVVEVIGVQAGPFSSRCQKSREVGLLGSTGRSGRQLRNFGVFALGRD